jgi:hypothetical protein
VIGNERKTETHSKFLLEDVFESYFIEENGEIEVSNYLKVRGIEGKIILKWLLEKLEKL